MESFEKRTGIVISRGDAKVIKKEKKQYNFDRSREYCEYYYNTDKVPPLNLLSWVTVYTIITSANII